MKARYLVLAATLALAAVACGASPAPAPVAPAPAPVAPAPPQPLVEPAAPAPAAPACSRVWNGHEAIPPEFLTCTTTNDCATASSGGCCPHPVAVNKAHHACMQAQPMPCDVICPSLAPLAIRCVTGTCKLVSPGG